MQETRNVRHGLHLIAIDCGLVSHLQRNVELFFLLQVPGKRVTQQEGRYMMRCTG